MWPLNHVMHNPFIALFAACCNVIKMTLKWVKIFIVPYYWLSSGF